MLLLTRWCRTVYEIFASTEVAAVDRLEADALALPESAQRELKRTEAGKWSGWMTGERKINLPKRMRLTREACNEERERIRGAE